MCDTLAMKREGCVWFAKNSDREPGEAQRVEVRDAVKGDAAPSLQCTYIEIPQVPDRRAVVLSRPDWMWGAEMGVNDAGVVIGNEAVFSRGMLRKGESLLGMDLVRLGIERSASAEEAAAIMTGLLEKFGQGGPAGYADKRFRYDNSFLIADRKSILVLETAGREWALKNVSDVWSISNTYTIRADYDAASAGTSGDFKSRHEALAMPRLACAENRRAATFAAASTLMQAMSLGALATMMRRHAGGDGFDNGSNNDVCMHAAGIFRPHASTASMIVKLGPAAPPRMAFTGAIHPCLSLFKPIGFKMPSATLLGPHLFETGLQMARRAARDPSFRAAVRRSIELVEPALLDAVEAGRIDEAEEIASSWMTQSSINLGEIRTAAR